LKIGEYESHEAADVFEMLEGAEAAALVADIREHGLRQAITRWTDGSILDGRNRLRACLEAGVPPRFDTYDGDPWDFVWSANAERRHLDPGQKVMKRLLWQSRRDVWREARAAKEKAANAARSAALAGNDNASKRLASAWNAGVAGMVTEEGPRRKKAIGEGPLSKADYVGTQKQSLTPVSATVSKARGDEERYTRSELARDTGVGVVTAQKAITIQKADPDLAERVAAGEVNLSAAYRQVTRAQAVEKINSEPLPLPTGPFRVIVADPPWAYEKRKDDGTHRSALSYPSMSTDEICAMPVLERAGDDAILWLWTTNAFMRDAYRVVDAWGFRERTILTWVKDRMGTGDWLRGKTEHCILAIRGKPVVNLTNQTTALPAPMREHSRKPDEFYALVESLCPGSKLEIFAREKREGWTAWGAETEKFEAAE